MMLWDEFEVMEIGIFGVLYYLYELDYVSLLFINMEGKKTFKIALLQMEVQTSKVWFGSVTF